MLITSALKQRHMECIKHNHSREELTTQWKESDARPEYIQIKPKGNDSAPKGNIAPHSGIRARVINHSNRLKRPQSNGQAE